MERAEVASTTGTVRFDGNGRRRSAAKRSIGTRVWGELEASDTELDEMSATARKILVPAGITLTFNGEAVPYREPLKCITATLPTELDDGSGRLRPSRRKTTIHIHRPAGGEPSMLYELGMPVAECGDAFSYDVLQKLPLGQDRDSVTTGYLAQLRAHRQR